jgi:hypothetical protein
MAQAMPQLAPACKPGTNPADNVAITFATEWCQVSATLHPPPLNQNFDQKQTVRQNVKKVGFTAG